MQSVRSFAPPCYCVGVNRFAIKSLLNTRFCKFHYIYNPLPGNWLVKILYLVQSVARIVQEAESLGRIKPSGMFDPCPLLNV